MRKLICLGDSLTFGLRVPHSQAWPRLVQTDTGMEVVNLGVSGDTTGGMLARLQPLLRESESLRQQTVVLIMGGSNDIFYSGSDICARSNMGALVHQTIAAGMMPVVGIPLPIAPEDAPADWGRVADFALAAHQLENYSLWLKEYCRAFRIPFVDFRTDFLAPDGSVRRELFCDGLHPTARGHQLMAQRLLSSEVLR